MILSSSFIIVSGFQKIHEIVGINKSLTIIIGKTLSYTSVLSILKCRIESN